MNARSNRENTRPTAWSPAGQREMESLFEKWLAASKSQSITASITNILKINFTQPAPLGLCNASAALQCFASQVVHIWKTLLRRSVWTIVYFNLFIYFISKGAFLELMLSQLPLQLPPFRYQTGWHPKMRLPLSACWIINVVRRTVRRELRGNCQITVGNSSAQLKKSADPGAIIFAHESHFLSLSA